MTRRAPLIAAVLLVFAALPAAAQPKGFVLEGAYWQTGPTGTVQVTGIDAAVPGGSSTLAFDLENDLALGKKGVYPFGFRFVGRKWRAEGEYLDASWAADAILTRDFVYQGVTYHASDLVASSLKVRDISGSLRYDLPLGGYASFGIGADVDYIRSEASLSVPARGASAGDERNFTAPLGTVALNVHDATGHFWLEVKGSYMSWSGNRGEKGRVEAGWAIQENYGLKVGWRRLDVTYVKDRGTAPEDRVQVKFEGYYAGLFLAF